jgi:hypothetical protein
MKELYNELEKIHFEIREFKEISEHFSERANSFKNNLIVFIEEKLFYNKFLIENLNDIIVNVSNKEEYLIAHSNLLNFSNQLLDFINKSKNLEELESWIEFNYFNEKFHILKSEQILQFENWFNGIQTEFDIFFTNSNDNIKSNEDLYREKLRLEAPAEYWKKRSEVLKNDGQKFLIWLVILIVFAANGLFILLFQIPDGMLLKVFDDKIIAIKWSIILVTMFSLLAYGIKILAKLTFSSYHLSRDAEEREQLTHFYLALKKDTTIEPEERQLILQSLFSRSDTGLLKEDSSPTMPSSIIEKFSGSK